MYDEAVAKASEKLKELKPEEVTRESARRVLDEISASFSAEFEKLSEPFRKAMIESYEEGLKETGIILSKREK